MKVEVKAKVKAKVEAILLRENVSLLLHDLLVSLILINQKY
jgi:hypothetical protein